MDKPTRTPIPPYLPFKTFVGILDNWRVVLPSRIDRGVLASQSGATQTWMISALRFFGLIDSTNTPTETLRTIVRAADADRAPMFANLARKHYPAMFATGFDLGHATHAQVKEKIEATGAQGDTAVKAMSFFVALAQAGKVPVSPYVKTRQRRGINGRRAKRQPTASGVQAPHVAATAPVVGKTHTEMLIDMLDVQTMDDDEQAAVWTLIRFLKKVR
jgi:hypothetical protein